MKTKTIVFLLALLLTVLAGCNNAPPNEDTPQPFSFSESVQSTSESEIYGTGCRKLSGQGLIRKQYGHRHFRHHRYGNRRSCWYEQRHFQQSLYYLGQIQKEMVSVLPAHLFPVPSHADGRRSRRRIFEKLAR